MPDGTIEPKKGRKFDQVLEGDPFVLRPEAEERLGRFGDVVMHVEEGSCAGLELGQRPVGHEHPIPHSGDFHERSPVELAFEHFAAQRSDHREAACRS